VGKLEDERYSVMVTLSGKAQQELEYQKLGREEDIFAGTRELFEAHGRQLRLLLLPVLSNWQCVGLVDIAL